MITPAANDPEFLRVTARDLWALDQICASIGEIRASMPMLRHVSVDLSEIRILDTQSLVSLDCALTHLDRAGILVSVLVHPVTALAELVAALE